MAHILIVLSAAGTLPLKNVESLPSGFWAQEFVPAFHSFLEHGHQISVATRRGKPAVLDEHCFAPEFHDHDIGRILNLREQLDEIEAWRNPLSLERLALSGTKFDAVFFPGGYGPLADLVDSEAAGNLVKRTVARHGLIGAVCHGAAGLITAQHEGKWLFSDYRLTCFSPAEENSAGLAPRLPELLADTLEKLGGKLSFAAPGQVHVIADRQLYTGQNPDSVAKLAYLMATQLKKMRSLDKNACAAPCD